MPGVARVQTGGLGFSVKVDLKDAQMRKAVDDAFNEANLALVTLFDLEFVANKWEWPYDKSPRDIKDDGILMGSYKAQPPSSSPNSKMVYYHRWRTEYATPVHQGYITSGGRMMPARPWSKEPLTKVQGIFNRIAGRNIRGIL